MAITVATEDLDKAIEEMASDINVLAQNDLIYSTLAKPGVISLELMDLLTPNVLFCLVLVPADREEEAKKLVKYSSTDFKTEA